VGVCAVNENGNVTASMAFAESAEASDILVVSLDGIVLYKETSSSIRVVGEAHWHDSSTITKRPQESAHDRGTTEE
jgi:hypothetical protein